MDRPYWRLRISATVDLPEPERPTKRMILSCFIVLFELLCVIISRFLTIIEGLFVTMTHKIENILNRFLALWAIRWIKLWTKGWFFCCRSMKLLKCISTVPTMWTKDYGHVLFLLFHCDKSPIFMETRISKYFSFKKCQNFFLGQNERMIAITGHTPFLVRVIFDDQHLNSPFIDLTPSHTDH
nr:MAG TPA: hypothetical protein [Caudoviricetes sp.]